MVGSWGLSGATTFSLIENYIAWLNIRLNIGVQTALS
jgi:hypothetical protein